MMNDTAKQFMQFAIDNQVLSFGEFQLKSGRVSPYFYNSGLFKTGHQIARLGEFYAQAIVDSGIEFDVLFGPAYKGIPLVCTVAIALAEKYGIDKPFCFNRKEAKDHGEGGNTVGAELRGRVLVIDDVVTKGTAFRESMGIIGQHEANIVGFIISFDRQERGQGMLSSVQEIEQEFSIPVVPIAKLDDVLDMMRQTGMEGQVLIEDYQQRYGV